VDVGMVLKQRSSVFDGFLLRIVFPYLHRSGMQRVLHLTSVWHKSISESSVR